MQLSFLARTEITEVERILTEKGLDINDLDLLYISTAKDERHHYQLYFENFSVKREDRGFRVQGIYCYDPLIRREGSGVMDKAKDPVKVRINRLLVPKK